MWIGENAKGLRLESCAAAVWTHICCNRYECTRQEALSEHVAERLPSHARWHKALDGPASYGVWPSLRKDLGHHFEAEIHRVPRQAGMERFTRAEPPGEVYPQNLLPDAP